MAGKLRCEARPPQHTIDDSEAPWARGDGSTRHGPHIPGCNRLPAFIIVAIFFRVAFGGWVAKTVLDVQQLRE
ncbi:hypothetical protein DB30_01934 [Enhygromyxa salina]|uniref:Uncharacterized protein n=1 Tax=Enhygromyxa salina TaxID=215803 RepID=A0A0C2DEE6_9BACT|nr:hypothetical protein [Enhygromyxa salina]KIG18047.1 hypothetical protein DB30_01934 [Enhygromyxa salina]